MFYSDNLSVSLTGDYFANKFQYLKLSLIPCVISTTNTCKSSNEVAAFFKNTPALQFMFIDSYIDVQDYKVLVHPFRNEEKFFLVDVTQTKSETVFFRSLFIENINEEDDKRHSTTIVRYKEDIYEFIDGESLFDITMRLDT